VRCMCARDGVCSIVYGGERSLYVLLVVWAWVGEGESNE